jgi:phenylalanine-4-hydroxylase
LLELPNLLVHIWQWWFASPEMFEEGQLYAPVTSEGGEVTVHLDENHPGVNDPAYRERRNHIAAVALEWSPGLPIPHIAYSDEEQEVWRTVCRELAAKHERLACAEYVEAAGKLGLPVDHIPQLDEVGDRLRPLTGFGYHPAAGLVPFDEFYGSLADGIFHSTQYVRHHARPLYTPEPDLVHEVIGHGNMLASPRFAELNRLAGQAARRLETKEGRDFFARVFWFTIEFGVIREDGELRAYGAGLLSSYGEIEEFRAADVRELDIAVMGVQAYDITKYQPILFAADGMDRLMDTLGGFFAECDDDSPARYSVGADADRDRPGDAARPRRREGAQPLAS